MGVNEVMNFIVEKSKHTLQPTVMGVNEVMNINVGKLKHTLQPSEMGVNEVMNFTVEKSKELRLAMENFGGEVVDWFDKVFPPETRGDKIHHWLHVATSFLIMAVASILFICIFRYCCRCCMGRGFGRVCVKMMKAPGRNFRMPRSVFESDPKGYFCNLRANPGKLR
ncbi:unnamed protein product [Fraxinus pennsylvanica]|uniref:Uncharacterized protein n=1 Tax=Fraxinus pennsylvanica TaxID=56036 RepID=A0AAD2DL58_9LAMI|nr:unnamed protein product [Fraxinus pennsylvanica]